MSDQNIPHPDPAEDSNQKELRAMAAADDVIADSALNMAMQWPRPAVRRRELPAFTNFFIGQKNIAQAYESSKGPDYCYCEHGEAVYEKWAFALWFAKTGYETWEDEFPAHDKLPDVWFLEPHHARIALNLVNAYEVILHRKAEYGDVAAQYLLMLAAHWDGPEVTLEEVGDFSDGLLNLQEFVRWSALLEVPLDLENFDATYDKWELAFWVYENIGRLPSASFGCMRQPDLARTICAARRKIAKEEIDHDSTGFRGIGHDGPPYAYDPLDGLGWNNRRILALLYRIESLFRGEPDKTETVDPGDRAVTMREMTILFEKMNLLMGMDMMEAFGRLTRRPPDHSADGSWDVAGWYDNVTVTLPRPLSIWSIE